MMGVDEQGVITFTMNKAKMDKILSQFIIIGPRGLLEAI